MNFLHSDVKKDFKNNDIENCLKSDILSNDKINKNNGQNPSKQKPHKKFMKGAEPFFIMKSTEVGVLLLHGFTSTPYQFKALANYLADKNLTVYAPIIAGHGTSPQDLADTSLYDWIESSEKAFICLKEKVKKVFIIGNSFGGNLAFYLAAKYNNPLSGVVSLGTPITLRYHKFLQVRLYTYGLLKRLYRKAGRDYKSNYIDLYDEISYPVIPIKSMRDFFYFIRKITIPSLSQVKSPALIIQASADALVHPKSVQYLHEHLGSDFKKVCWFNGNHHALTDPHNSIREEIFKKIHEFIEELLGKREEMK